MLIPRLAFFIALLSAVVASQLPEFAQQYRQRLGGAIDELNREVMRFSGEAQAENLTPEAAIVRLRQNPDDLAQKRGVAMDDAIARLGRLERQRDSFTEAGPIVRVLAMMRDFDPAIASRAYDTFEPAVPTTAEGFVAAALGFFAGGGLMRLVALPFRRRPPPAETVVDRREAEAEEKAARIRASLLRQRINRYTLPTIDRVPERERSESS